MLTPPRRFIDNSFRTQPGSHRPSSRCPPWPSSARTRAAPSLCRRCCAPRPSRICGSDGDRGIRPGRTSPRASDSGLRRCVNDGGPVCRRSRSGHITSTTYPFCITFFLYSFASSSVSNFLSIFFVLIASRYLGFFLLLSIRMYFSPVFDGLYTLFGFLISSAE